MSCWRCTHRSRPTPLCNHRSTRAWTSIRIRWFVLAHLILTVDSAVTFFLHPSTTTALCPSSSSPHSPPRAACWLPAPPSMPTLVLSPCNRGGTTAETDSTLQRNGDTPDRRLQRHQMCLGETAWPSCLLPEDPTQCSVILSIWTPQTCARDGRKLQCAERILTWG